MLFQSIADKAYGLKLLEAQLRVVMDILLEGKQVLPGCIDSFHDLLFCFVHMVLPPYFS